MSFYYINGAQTPLNNINGSFVNVDNSHVQGIPFNNTVIPNGPHTLAPAGSNVQGAAGIYPCSLKGGKINKRKINKISRQYKMKGSKKHARKMKTRLKKKYSRRYKSKTRRMSGGTSSRSLRGGNFLRGGDYSTMPPAPHSYLKGGYKLPHYLGGANAATAPNYPAGYTQYDNNKVFSNTYSTGGPLAPQLSALANPPPYAVGRSEVDNLNHADPNSYGNYGAGSGFPSRGWF